MLIDCAFLTHPPAKQHATAGPRCIFDAFTNFLFNAECGMLRRTEILDPQAIFPLDWLHSPQEHLHQCRHEQGPEAEAKCKELVITPNVSLAITYWLVGSFRDCVQNAC